MNGFTKPQLGVGMDLPWGKTQGFAKDINGDTVTKSVERFFESYSNYFGHVFFAFQPKNRADLNAGDYSSAFKSFFDCCSTIKERALHHTMLNMAGESDYSRRKILEFTNEIIQRFNIKWVNEDVGIWSLEGKSLPYPLPPILTERSLEQSIKAVTEIKRDLTAPLVLEFPGFTEGSAIIIGEMHAYDYFRTLAMETDSLVNLDTGHLISYQYLRGKRGPDLLSELHRLPLELCFEVHLAGSELNPSGFRDMHHGIILEEQFQLLDYLKENCSNLHAVTYEDPRFDNEGVLLENTQQSFEKLCNKMA